MKSSSKATIAKGAGSSESGKTRKRQRSEASAASSSPSFAWTQLPKFMDASSNLSAGLFGSRRLPELKDLYAQVIETTSDENGSNKRSRRPKQHPDAAFRSGGGKTSSRHLRRRTTAFRTKSKFHRYPVAASSSQAGPPTKRNATRRSRRTSQETLSNPHLEWMHTKRKNPASSGATTSTSTNESKSQPVVHWLTTHKWHSKRFHMEELWGWKIPMGHTNRGARSTLRLAQEGYTCLQDLTWERGEPLTLQTTSPSTSLPFKAIQTLTRICPSLASFLSDPTNKKSSCIESMGEGVLHCIDEFPGGAIGPTWWHVVSISADRTSTTWALSFRVHPAIRRQVEEAIQALLDDNESLGSGLEWVNDEASANMKARIPKCCFRVTGHNATETIGNVLRPILDSASAKETSLWPWLQQETSQDLANDSWKEVPHATLFRLKLQTEASDGSVAEQPKEVVLVRQAPRALDCRVNHSVAGWDIYSPSSNLTHEIWMSLSISKCVAIGLVEQSAQQLECQPPLPSFPRDWIDTEASKQYWMGKEPSWRAYRLAMEGGWGRWRSTNQKVEDAIPWPILVRTDDLTNIEEKHDDSNSMDGSDAKERETNSEKELEGCVVVVRGSFGEPFVSAIQGCGQAAKQSSTSKRRRNRRRAKPLNLATEIPPLPKIQDKTWRSMLSTLSRSLSLPAVLQAHVRCRKEGTLSPGSRVFVGGSLVGYLTLGAFSRERGLCHGIALVGASRLLKTMEISSRLGRLVRLPSGRTNVEIAATVHENGNEATISLIL